MKPKSSFLELLCTYYIKEPLLWKFGCLLGYCWLIPLPKPLHLLFVTHTRCDEHLKLFGQHFELKRHVIVHLYLLKKLLPKNWVIDKKMLQEGTKVLLPNLVHSFLHQLLHPKWRAEGRIKNLLVI
jgi:hypothetical protein